MSKLTFLAPDRGGGSFHPRGTDGSYAAGVTWSVVLSRGVENWVGGATALPKEGDVGFERGNCDDGVICEFGWTTWRGIFGGTNIVEGGLAIPWLCPKDGPPPAEEYEFAESWGQRPEETLFRNPEKD